MAPLVAPAVEVGVTSRHAINRAAERLSPAELAQARAAADTYLKAHPRGSHAVRLMSLGKQRGVPWDDRSNGDEVWAIIRAGRVTTIMLRRSTQPVTRAAFDVDVVALHVAP